MAHRRWENRDEARRLCLRSECSASRWASSGCSCRDCRQRSSSSPTSYRSHAARRRSSAGSKETGGWDRRCTASGRPGACRARDKMVVLASMWTGIGLSTPRIVDTRAGARRSLGHRGRGRGKRHAPLSSCARRPHDSRSSCRSRGAGAGRQWRAPCSLIPSRYRHTPRDEILQKLEIRVLLQSGAQPTVPKTFSAPSASQRVRAGRRAAPRPRPASRRKRPNANSDVQCWTGFPNETASISAVRKWASALSQSRSARAISPASRQTLHEILTGPRSSRQFQTSCLVRHGRPPRSPRATASSPMAANMRIEYRNRIHWAPRGSSNSLKTPSVTCSSARASSPAGSEDVREIQLGVRLGARDLPRRRPIFALVALSVLSVVEVPKVRNNHQGNSANDGGSLRRRFAPPATAPR